MFNYTLEIILPVKNGEKYIHDSIGCVLNQTIIENIRLRICRKYNLYVA